VVVADLYCKRLKECDRGNFLAGYYRMSDCRISVDRTLTELLDIADDLDCGYDAEGAGLAWSELASMTCKAFYEEQTNESLKLVWDECALSFSL
jgi:hypothetical protein